MKTTSHSLRLQGRCGNVALALALFVGTMHGAPLGTTFTYHGRLNDGGSPATGNYDLHFALYDAGTGGALVGTPTMITLAPVGVSNGLFLVTLDFGGAAFTGDARWLEMSVRSNGVVTPHIVLSPRQPLAPTPYALFTPTAATATSVPWSALTGLPAGFADGIDNDTTYNAGVGLALSGSVFSINPLGVTTSMVADGAITAAKIGDAQAVKSLNGFTDHVTLFPGPNIALTPDPLGNNIQISALSSGWSLTGNAGTSGANFIGTTDTQPLEFKVGGARALRLEPHDVSPNLLGGSPLNIANGGVRGGTIGGGGDFSFGDVLWNIVSDDFGTVGGGLANLAGNDAGSIGDAKYATVGGGSHNTASGIAATVPGGIYNRAAGTASLAAGQRAKAEHNGAFVWADSTPGDFSSGGSDQFLIRASGGVGIGTSFPVKALDVRDGSGAGRDGGGIHVGGTGANGDAKLINFGDGDFVHVGELYRDDLLDLKAATISMSTSFVGVGTTNPAANFHLYTGYNPTTMRLQSAGGFGSASLEFWSDPQGSLYEWRPGFIQSTDSGGFTGGLGFYVNGTGFESRQGAVEVMRLVNGNVGIGTATPGVKLDVIGEARVSVLTITGGADVAEPFQMSARDIPQGAVVVIDEKNPGRLTMSNRAYDHRVAGIVSGANGVKPGLTLQQEGVLEGGQNVALSGRVYVLADAANGSIQPGDLLTTSSVPGHAMKVTEHGKAQGAILGKSMGSLARGRGMVLVLVSLQ